MQDQRFSSQKLLPRPTVFTRRLDPLDSLLAEMGRAMQVLGGTIPASRPNPAGKRPVNAVAPAAQAEKPAQPGQSAEPGELSPQQRRHSAGLMRVNHVGEICAQALYRGQAAFCRDETVRNVFRQAAAEEVDHLVWCQQRLDELQSRPSILNPLWYAGSFALGALASRAGTGRNLGFMAETEKQVEQHLDGHLQQLPPDDSRSRAIVHQMREDEIAHRKTAENRGAKTLALPVRLMMRCMSRVMTMTAYRL